MVTGEKDRDGYPDQRSYTACHNRKSGRRCNARANCRDGPGSAHRRDDREATDQRTFRVAQRLRAEMVGAGSGWLVGQILRRSMTGQGVV